MSPSEPSAPEQNLAPAPQAPPDSEPDEPSNETRSADGAAAPPAEPPGTYPTKAEAWDFGRGKARNVFSGPSCTEDGSAPCRPSCGKLQYERARRRWTLPVRTYAVGHQRARAMPTASSSRWIASAPIGIPMVRCGHHSTLTPVRLGDLNHGLGTPAAAASQVSVPGLRSSSTAFHNRETSKVTQVTAATARRVRARWHRRALRVRVRRRER